MSEDVGGLFLQDLQESKEKASITRINIDPMIQEYVNSLKSTDCVNKIGWIQTPLMTTDTNKQQNIAKPNKPPSNQHKSYIEKHNISDNKDIISPYITTLSISDKLIEERKFKIHIAIDFGTDGCALASAFNGQVEVYDRWRSKNFTKSVKTKTSILLNEKNEVVSFGDDAKNMFIVGQVYKDKWKLFERFKMALYHDKIERKEESKIDISDKLTATNGQSCSSEIIFVKAFEHLHNEAKQYLSKFGGFNIKPHDIQWIITVPSIWNDVAKIKMKHWAIKAGLADKNIPNQIKIVYEPDAASLAIQHEIYHHVKKTVPQSDEKDADNIYKFMFMKEEQYILVDGGGGTVDVTCHEILGDLTLGTFGVKEILPSSGGKFGSCYIDDQFMQLLETIFSTEWMREFEAKQQNVYVDIINNFQQAKATFYQNSESNRHFVLLPQQFLAFLDEKCAEKGANPGDVTVNGLITTYSKYMGLMEEKKLNHNENNESFMNFLKAHKLYDGLYQTLQENNVDLEMLLEDCKKDEVDQYCKDMLNNEHKFKFRKLMRLVHNKQYIENNGQGKKHGNEFYMHVDHWKRLFDHVINPIIEHVEMLLDENKHKLNKAKYLCLVGGLACSEYFKCRMKSQFGKNSKYKFTVIIPDAPMLSVVKGAAYLGITDNYIRARVMKRSYGHLCSYPRNYASLRGVPYKHVLNNSFYNKFANEIWVNDCFEPFVIKNQEVLSTVSYQSALSRIDDENNDTLYIICSDKKNPKVMSDGKILGELKIPFNGVDEKQQVQIEFHFYDTTLHVYAYSKHDTFKKEIPIHYVESNIS